MQTRSVTIYFLNVDDARKAQASLRDRGVSAELYPYLSDPPPPPSSGFITRIRDFLGAPRVADYSHGACLTISNANEETIAILHEYGGRMNSSKDANGSKRPLRRENLLRV